MMKQRRVFTKVFVLAPAVLALAGCSDSSGGGNNSGSTGGSVTITAPGIVSPATGAKSRAGLRLRSRT